MPHQPVTLDNPHAIRLYIDSADRAAAEPWLRTGMFSGVTTNPQLLREAGQRVADIPTIYDWARDNGAREICFQTWGATVEEQYRSAMQIREAAPGSTIKVPVTPVGAEVISRLRDQDIPVLMTAVYSAKQALIGSALGVKYIAPYFNRMFRAGRNAPDEIAHMTRAIPQDGSGPMIMAASIKSAQHLVTLTDIGVRVFTISPDIIADLFADDLTANAVRDFEAFMEDVI
ncbi:transaldolase family protein [Propioniciclava soli]|uniref:Transaldolase family protein n=1 Tax=Propioniciclava soli TaxID=2775081 RepID=A0ABZ3C9D4_9ACTN|nr:transaldolase family protein [Propioniciclava soli]